MPSIRGSKRFAVPTDGSREIHDLNTDLDLISSGDLTELGDAFRAGGLIVLHLAPAEDGLWYATFEAGEQYPDPEPSIGEMLAVVEELPPRLREVWSGCTRRVFDPGYEGGDRPFGFHHDLSADPLARIASLGASLGFTLYPASG